MNKTVQSIVSLTAFSALLIVITLFCGFTFLALIHNQLIINYLKQATIEIGNDLETTQVHRFA